MSRQSKKIVLPKVVSALDKLNWRTKIKVTEEVIDNYERANQLGKYAPQQINAGTTYKKPEYPTLLEVDETVDMVEGLLNTGLYMTTKEGVRQDFELSLHHIRIARRYFRKAFTI